MTENKEIAQIKPYIYIYIYRERESNFELLRLVCMLFIILHHFIVHGLKTSGYPDESSVTFFGIAFNSLFVIAVNCFVLISGYHSIKASPKGFFRLYIMCVFYLVLLNAFIFVQNDFSLEFVEKRGIVMPFSHTKYWFIRSYFYLFLLSPFLNKITSNCNKREFIGLLFIGSIITFYFGYLWSGDINSNGYNFMNFIFLYFIGRFIALHTTNEKTEKNKWIAMFVVMLCSLLIIGIVEVLSHFGLQDKIWKYGYYYNSPLVVISAVAFFLFFRNLKVQSKIINWAAVSVLAVYLVHDNRVVNQLLLEYVSSLSEQIGNNFVLGCVLFLFAVGVLFVCILFDKVRMIITNPIEKMLNRIPLENYFSKFADSINRIVK